MTELKGGYFCRGPRRMLIMHIQGGLGAAAKLRAALCTKTHALNII